MRDDFPDLIKRILAARAGNRCSNPDCHAPTSGPQLDPTKTLNVGVAAHISAASPGGPRHNLLMSSEQRQHPSNGIWLCQSCAKLVDNDVLRYPEEELLRWKKKAEADASSRVGKTEIPAAPNLESLVRQESAATRQQLVEVQEELRRLVQDTPLLSAGARESALQARVDEARDLLRAGKPTSAREILTRLRLEVAGHSISSGLAFRIASNLGSCALQLGDRGLATAEFRRALAAEPENPKALANAALGACLTGAAEEALQLITRCRQLEPRDAHAAAVHLEVLNRLDRLEDLDQLICAEPWIENDSTCCGVMGEISYRAGAYDKAEAYTRKAISLGKDRDPESLHLLALAIAAQTGEHSIGRALPPAWRKCDGCNVAPRLDEAVEALTEAIAVLEQREGSIRLSAAFANRAALRGMQFRFADAINDCQRALSINPEESVALHNLPDFMLALDRVPEAIDAFRRIPLDTGEPSTALSLAFAYLRAGKHESAIGLLEPILIFGPEEEHKLRAGELLLWAYHDTGRYQDSAGILNALVQIWPSDPNALRVVATQHERIGERREAVGALRAALGHATGPIRGSLAVQLADLLANLGQYAEAAALYAESVDVSTNNPLAVRYLLCLFNADQLGEALQVSRQIRGSGPPIPVVSEVEARVLETAGELTAARELRSGLAKVEPKNTGHRFAIAVIGYRRGNLEEAQAALESLSLKELLDNPERLMGVAQLRSVLKMPEALRFGYEARRSGFGTAEIHLAYIGLVLRREKDDDAALQKSIVEVDCMVDLRDQTGGLKVFTITDDPDLSRGEIAADSPLAAMLMGHCVGDTIVAKEGPLETVQYDIANVRSKYVGAFQDSLLNFSTWFAGHEGFYRITVQDNDYSKIFFTLDQRNALANQVQAMYLSGHLTLGTMAHLLGTTQFVVWAGLVVERDGRLVADSGTHEELAKSIEILENCTAVVLDAIALFTLRHLRLLEHLTRLSPKVLVAQAVIDEIRESIEEELRRKGGGSIGKAGEKYFMQDFSDEFVEGRVRCLEEIQAFIGSNATAVEASAAIDLGTARLEELETLLGKGAIASIYGAKDKGAVLISDDGKLKEVARKDFEIHASGSQALLVLFRRHGLLTEDEYHQHVAALAIANYHFIFFEARTLVWATESEAARFSPSVPALLRSLSGPECSQESAVQVVADAIRGVWLTPGLPERKTMFLDLALNALAKGRSATVAIRQLVIALRGRFALAPLQLADVGRTIALWLQTRGLGGR